WLRDHRPDAVITSTATIPVPALASRVLGIPHVWWVHEFVTLDHGLSFLLGEPVSQRLMGWLSRLVVVNSAAVGEHYCPPIPRSKTRVVHYGIPSIAAAPRAGDDTPIRVLLLGRQTPSKGQSTAIKAAALLQAQGIGVQFRLVGPGSAG